MADTGATKMTAAEINDVIEAIDSIEFALEEDGWLYVLPFTIRARLQRSETRLRRLVIAHTK